MKLIMRSGIVLASFMLNVAMLNAIMLVMVNA